MRGIARASSRSATTSPGGLLMMMKRFSLFASLAILGVVGSGLPARAADPPSRRVFADVGDVGQPGQVSESADELTVAGAGADIWDAADAFTFVYQSLPGTSDIETIMVRLQSETATESFA